MLQLLIDIIININIFLKDPTDHALTYPEGCCLADCIYHLKWSVPNTSQITFDLNFKTENNKSWAAVGFAEESKMVRSLC